MVLEISYVILDIKPSVLDEQKIFYKYCVPTEIWGSFRTWLYFHNDVGQVVYAKSAQYMQLNSILKLDSTDPVFVYYLNKTSEAIVCEVNEAGAEIVTLDFKAKQRFSKSLKLGTNLMLPIEAIWQTHSSKGTAFTQEKVQKPFLKSWCESIFLQ